ncbi:hypothetical protein KUCAC02_019375 [Chaenocephalus aceratus]|uniref:Uncharacterized protein n=1 Tax=Chaenocephalus aceratus TaxID=36190 RepID=A0ACB9VNW3_CHAAC|nr:hypothetical protein KUCAC02_019375 [Chaenocephalus aceratus]
MWTLGLQVVVICVFLQVPGCFPSCLIIGSVANCGSKNLRWVPPLPPHITHLFLEMNHISEMNSSSLSGLEQLQELDLGRQYVPLVIRNNSFSGQSRLRRLVLGFNIGLQLEPQAFIGLSGLQNLHLDYCSLQDTILKENFLEPLSSLQSLDLFGHMGKGFSFNNLPDPDRSTFQGLNESSIRTLDLSKNRIFALQQGLKRLKHLLYGGNTIRRCTLSGRASAIGLNEVQVLDLHSSSLQAVWSQGRCLNLFDNLGHMIGVNLRLNALKSLPQGIFKGLTSVVEIDLSSNSLTYLHNDVLPKSLKILNLSNNFVASPDPAAFRFLSFLDLNMNRFHCDSNLKSFLSWLNKTNVTFLSPVEDLRCEYPSGFYKVPLLDYSTQVTQQ